MTYYSVCSSFRPTTPKSSQFIYKLPFWKPYASLTNGLQIWYRNGGLISSPTIIYISSRVVNNKENWDTMRKG